MWKISLIFVTIGLFGFILAEDNDDDDILEEFYDELSVFPGE